MLEKYAQVDHFVLSKNATPQEWAKIRIETKNYNLVISGVSGNKSYTHHRNMEQLKCSEKQLTKLFME